MTVPFLLRGVRDGVRQRMRRARHRWTATRLDEATILSALSTLPIATPMAVCVHSSLSACGYVEGGADSVIRALRAWNGGGTLMMPAHSYCYPKPGHAAPVFDVTSTPSVVGAVTDVFWRQGDVLRSLHPTHSLAVEGPRAGELIAGHDRCDTPCGRGTPYERMAQSDCAVLMFGATLDAYTLFHTAEDAVGVPYLYEPEPVTLRYRDTGGHERQLRMRRQDVTIKRSFRQKDGWLERRGLLHRAVLGDGELLLIPDVRAAHLAILAELKKSPSFLRAS